MRLLGRSGLDSVCSIYGDIWSSFPRLDMFSTMPGIDESLLDAFPQLRWVLGYVS
jgi:hypothetical protein